MPIINISLSQTTLPLKLPIKGDSPT